MGFSALFPSFSKPVGSSDLIWACGQVPYCWAREVSNQTIFGDGTFHCAAQWKHGLGGLDFVEETILKPCCLVVL